MSEAAPRGLLARDREELDYVCLLLRDSRTVVAFLVCEAALRPEAIACLQKGSGLDIPEPIALSSAEQTLEILSAGTNQLPSSVQSLALTTADPDVLRTFNWHREKLRQGGSSLLWLEDVDALRAVRELAPDAYSFRDLAVIVRGQQTLPRAVLSDNTPDILIFRDALKRAKGPVYQAEAMFRLAESMRNHSSTEEASRLAEQGLAMLEDGGVQGDYADEIRAGLLATLSAVNRAQGAEASAWRLSRQGLQYTERSASNEGRWRRLFLLAAMPSANGVDHDAAASALAEIDHSAGNQGLEVQTLHVAALSHHLRGDLIECRRSLTRARSVAGIDPFGRAIVKDDEAQLEIAEGRLPDAEKLLSDASELKAKALTGNEWESVTFAESLCLRGELQAARSVLLGLHTGAQHPGIDSDVAAARAELEFEAGEPKEGTAIYRAAIADAERASRDGALYRLSASYVNDLERAAEAERLDDGDLEQAMADLEVAEDVSLALAGDEPPWYRILYPGLRSRITALVPSRLAEVIELARLALGRARAQWPQFAPAHATLLATTLFRAERFDEARRVVEGALGEAKEKSHWNEYARQRALGIAIELRLGADRASVDSALADLGAVFDKTGPRFAAETRLSLAQRIDPRGSILDPLSLLLESYTAFLDFPMPGHAARSLEAMGDVLVARQKPAEAARRYRAALTTLESYGLGLRIPLLTRKLAGPLSVPISPDAT